MTAPLQTPSQGYALLLDQDLDWQELIDLTTSVYNQRGKINVLVGHK